MIQATLVWEQAPWRSLLMKNALLRWSQLFPLIAIDTRAFEALGHE